MKKLFSNERMRIKKLIVLDDRQTNQLFCHVFSESELNMMEQ